MISTVTRTQQQAITIIFVWVMIALALSGFLVPINSLPGVLNFAANALPLQHFIEIVRSVMLRGAGLSALWPHVLSLIALDIVVVTATIFLLRRLGT
jgi:ABC-2 type transport system permease protein